MQNLTCHQNAHKPNDSQQATKNQRKRVTYTKSVPQQQSVAIDYYKQNVFKKVTLAILLRVYILHNRIQGFKIYYFIFNISQETFHLPTEFILNKQLHFMRKKTISNDYTNIF